MRKIHVIKADGTVTAFDPNKVIGTCIRAGSSRNTAKKIAQRTKNMIYDGITTSQIYKIVLKNISDTDETGTVKHRYRLKESIMKMGPAGFPFESYLSQILQYYGYEIESVRTIVKGACVNHEIDIIARNKKQRYLVECKYHHRRGIHTNLKQSLYTHARFLDLREQFDGEILSCNTKLSHDALAYAKCVGQKLLCWKHPTDKGLENMIDEKGLYPITLLNLNKSELIAFSKIKFMIAKDLLTTDLNKLSKKTNIPFSRLVRLQRLTRNILQ